MRAHCVRLHATHGSSDAVAARSVLSLQHTNTATLIVWEHTTRAAAPVPCHGRAMGTRGRRHCVRNGCGVDLSLLCVRGSVAPEPVSSGVSFRQLPETTLAQVGGPFVVSVGPRRVGDTPRHIGFENSKVPHPLPPLPNNTSATVVTVVHVSGDQVLSTLRTKVCGPLLPQDPGGTVSPRAGPRVCADRAPNTPSFRPPPRLTGPPGSSLTSLAKYKTWWASCGTVLETVSGV